MKEQTPKRGRGRPRKIQPVEDAPPVDVEPVEPTVSAMAVPAVDDDGALI